MGRVQNKIALITGAAKGIGAATARLLASEGAKVIVTDILVDEGRALAKEIQGQFLPLDVGNPHSWLEVQSAVMADYGYLDILFNNAGITGINESLGPQDPEHTSLDSWEYIHRVNLTSVFLGCQFAIKAMKDKGGAIVNMSSRSGLVGIPGAAAYSSSKAGIRNYSKTVALYCAQQGYPIRCNSVYPGAILTPLWDEMLSKDGGDALCDKKIAAVASGVPLGHMGEPLDVAYAVLYFASDESKYLTGAELNIDGGILAGSASSPGKVEDDS